MNICNELQEGGARPCVFCIRSQAHEGVRRKQAWLAARSGDGLHLLTARNAEGGRTAFIEFTAGENAWRPVDAPGWTFIHCLMTVRKQDRRSGAATALVHACEAQARSEGRFGVAVMTSDGPWMASPRLFQRLGYTQVDTRGRFRLLAKADSPSAPRPRLLDWSADWPEYAGWHLVFADQCPWHAKAVDDLSDEAAGRGIQLHVHRLRSATEARSAPSGFGTFALMHDGRLLVDHYISRTRFRTLLRKAGAH